MKALVVYYSQGGTTRKMAQVISGTIKEKGLEVDLFSVEETDPESMLDYEIIVIGSPTYYGTMAAPIKEFLDKSVAFHGKLDGKIGGAFSSSANVGGGNETTVLSILQALLIHGMIVQGDPKGDHYGPVAVGGVDKRCEFNCRRLAQRLVELVK
jgi:NAD(P)H dehydrogenase (quinone)